MEKKMNKAQRIANAIKRNVDEWYADIVTYERMGERNARLWKRAALAGVDDDVIEIVKPKISSLH